MKTAFYLAVTSILILGAMSAQADISTGLVWHYQLEGNLTDSVGTNNGAALGAVSYVAGPADSLSATQAAEFDPTERANLAQTSFIGANGDFSVAYWVKVVNGTDPAVQSNLHVLDNGTWGPGSFITEMKLNQAGGAGQTNFGFGYGGANFMTAYKIPHGEWHHVSYTYDADALSEKLKFYVDGEFRESVNITIPSIGGTTYFGGFSTWGNPTGYKIDLDDVRFYNETISGAIIQVLAGLGETPKLTYSPEGFTEAASNDGSILNTIAITLDWDTFTADAVSGGYVTASNVPAGLTAVFTRDSDVQITMSLTGNATNHTVADNISNLTVTFVDGAFAGGNAVGVTDSTKSDLTVEFMNPADILSNLLAHYSFNDPLDLGHDDSENGRNATKVGDVAALAGRFDGAAYFDGAGDYLNDTSSYAGSSVLSFAVWVKHENTGSEAFASIFHTDGAWADGVWHCLLRDGVRLQISQPDNNPVDHMADTDIPMGEWHHIAAVLNGPAGTFDLYYDGAPDGALSSLDVVAAPFPMNIGSWNTERFFKGSMDDLVFYERALTLADIAKLYAEGFEGPPEPTSTPRPLTTGVDSWDVQQ
jgi:hypothetical protein